MSKIDLSTDYDPDAIASQKQFITEIGPYYALVTLDDRVAFYHRLENYWFMRWPLAAKNYIDNEFMMHRKTLILKVF